MASNKQSVVKSFLWAFVVLVVMVILGVKFRTNYLGWLIGGLVYAGGLAYLIKGYVADDEETIAPDAIMAIGLAIVATWGAVA